MEKEEYTVYPWMGLLRDDGRLYYLTKEKNSLFTIDQKTFSSSGDYDAFYIEGEVLYALKPDKVYYFKDGNSIDVFSENKHAILLKRNTYVTFGFQTYKLQKKSKFDIDSLSNTYWTGEFLQHLLHQFSIKTRYGGRWIYFWNSEKEKSNTEFLARLCYDSGKTLNAGKSMIDNNGAFHKKCEEYFKSFVSVKVKKLPSALFEVIRRLIDSRQQFYGKVLLCSKDSEVMNAQDRIVLYHSSKEHLKLVIDILKGSHNLMRYTYHKSKTRYAMKIPPFLTFRQGGASIRDYAKKVKKLSEYFSGVNHCEIKKIK